jgi:adenylyl-sulfate kinase
VNTEDSDSRHTELAIIANCGVNQKGDFSVSRKSMSENSSILSVQDGQRLSMELPEHHSPTKSNRTITPRAPNSRSFRTPTPVLWLTGLPSAGKSTIAKLTAQRLTTEGIPCEVLDGDEVRKAISPTLAYSREERALQALRLAWIAEMLSRHGVVAIVAAVTPFRDDRRAAATLLGRRYAEIWVHADVAVCRARDPKGLWRRCELGEISGFTGFDAPYEEPSVATMKFDTEIRSAAYCANELIDFVFARVGASLYTR